MEVNFKSLDQIFKYRHIQHKTKAVMHGNQKPKLDFDAINAAGGYPPGFFQSIAR